ncbi:MAG TPA: hypothetical protein VFQ45_03995 [Longimicrobium sp.]|nr:hypothetical protein [Longimicrobium sp.]
MANNLPQIPGYFALRQGADQASSVRGETVFFNYEPGAVAITEPGAAGSVRVSTAPSAGSRPTVQNARIHVNGYQPCELPGDLYSAILWSESAVEKFLLPYYVSAGGPHAYEVLQAIHKAFYLYDESTPVVALVFGYASQPVVGRQHLWNTVQVVYGSGGSLAMATLLDFTERPAADLVLPPSPPPPPLGSPVTFAQKSESRTLVDSVGAREVAEYVSGLRGHEVRVYSPPGPDGPVGPLVPSLTPLDLAGYELLYDAFSPYHRADRPVATVELEVDGVWRKQEVSTPGAENVPDAVFWTDGAVEMLMVPYYASVAGQGAPAYLTVLLGKWAGSIQPDVVDPLKLRTLTLEALVLLLEGAETEDSTVYAIIHLPRSEYVDEPIDATGAIGAGPRDAFWLENRTWLMTLHGPHPLVQTGGERLVPLRTFNG